MLKSLVLETPYLTIHDERQKNCDLDEFDILPLQLIERYLLQKCYSRNILFYYTLFLQALL